LLYPSLLERLQPNLLQLPARSRLDGVVDAAETAIPGINSGINLWAKDLAWIRLFGLPLWRLVASTHRCDGSLNSTVGPVR
jgi:hypothetical protein